eukprot:jgi/Chlat1/1740/Chrsp13S02170
MAAGGVVGGMGAMGQESRTLWIGDLPWWMDEAYLTQLLNSAAREVNGVKVMRNKLTGQPEGYGFIECASHASAERILATYNGQPVTGTEYVFRLNWATFGIGEKRPADGSNEHSLFVGDLPPEATDQILMDTFRARYGSVRGAKVVTDPATYRAKGYGFVRFGEEMERDRALTEMNGQYCLSRPMRISVATPKRQVTGTPTTPLAIPSAASASVPTTPTGDPDLANTTVFVGGLDSSITEEHLKQYFEPFGDIIYVKIPIGKGCGFVQYSTRSSAEQAIAQMHGQVVGSQTLRLSWGKSPAHRQKARTPTGASYDPNYQYYADGSAYAAYGAYAMPGTYDPYGYYSQHAQPRPQYTADAAMTAQGIQQAPAAPEEDAPLDVDALNEAYIAEHESAHLDRYQWLCHLESLQEPLRT